MAKWSEWEIHRKLKRSDRNTKIFLERNVEEKSSMYRCIDT